MVETYRHRPTVGKNVLERFWISLLRINEAEPRTRVMKGRASERGNEDEDHSQLPYPSLPRHHPLHVPLLLLLLLLLLRDEGGGGGGEDEEEEEKDIR